MARTMAFIVAFVTCCAFMLSSHRLGFSKVLDIKKPHHSRHDANNEDPATTIEELQGKLALINMIKARLATASAKEAEARKAAGYPAARKEIAAGSQSVYNRYGDSVFDPSSVPTQSPTLLPTLERDACLPMMTIACGDKYDEETCQTCLGREYKTRQHYPEVKCWLRHMHTLCPLLFQGPTGFPTAAPSDVPSTAPSTATPTLAPTINAVLSCQAALTKQCPHAYEPRKCSQCVGAIPTYGLQVLGPLSTQEQLSSTHCSVDGLQQLCGSPTDLSNGFREFFATPGYCNAGAATRCLQLAKAGLTNGFFSLRVCLHCMSRWAVCLVTLDSWSTYCPLRALRALFALFALFPRAASRFCSLLSPLSLSPCRQSVIYVPGYIVLELFKLIPPTTLPYLFPDSVALIYAVEAAVQIKPRTIVWLLRPHSHQHLRRLPPLVQHPVQHLLQHPHWRLRIYRLLHPHSYRLVHLLHPHPHQPLQKYQQQHPRPHHPQHPHHRPPGQPPHQPPNRRTSRRLWQE
jgi:hypothetical protein